VTKEAHWKGTTWVPNGTVHTVNERIDLSVFRRCQLQPKYRPPNLIEWAKRKGLDLEGIIANPEKYPQLYAPVATTGIESAVQARVPASGAVEKLSASLMN
jgi:hypothetical protein